MDKIKIVLIGIGGYGGNYTHFLRTRTEQDFTLEGVVDPFADKAPEYDWVREQGVPIYQTPEEFYAEKNADLAMIATPIPLHRDHCLCAMEHGSNVLVEKPLCPTLQDADLLAEVSRRTGKFLAVGYQWSFSRPILDLKADILAGKLGKPLYMKAFVSWKRFKRYYSGYWKGKYRDADGNWILDSVITNATAHYLHNLFFVAGASLPDGAALNAAAMPEKVRAETYHVKPDTETPDVFVLRGTLPEGVPFWYGCSYSLAGDACNRFEFRYEKAWVRFGEDEPDERVRAVFNDGTVKDYGDPQCHEEIYRKFDTVLRMAKGEDVPLTCGISTILPHLTVTDAIFDRCPEGKIPEKYLVTQYEKPGEPDSDTGAFAKVLRDELLLCYAQMKLPSELGYSWTLPPVEFRPAEIRRFDGSRYL